MKGKIKIICIFAAISFVLQTGVLLILNNKVFQGFADDNIVVSKNAANASKAEKKEQTPKVKINISSNAKDVSTARSNKYIAYIEDNKINYIDTKNGEKKTINDIEPQCYKWASDDNIIITAKDKKNLNRVNIYLYDITTNNLKKTQQIKFNDEDSKIEEILCSPLKNLIFLKVREDNKDKLYKVNMKNEVDDVKTVTNNIEKMSIIPHEDKIIYKANSIPKFYITYCNKKIKFDTDNEMMLLGVDEQDRIFAAERDKKEINKIRFGTMNDDPNSWNQISVGKNINVENLIVSDNGIYYIDKDNSVIENLENKKKVKYKGKVISINKQKAFSINENRIESINL